MQKSKHLSINEFQAKFEGLEIAQNLESITGGDVPPQITPRDSSSPAAYVVVGPVSVISAFVYTFPQGYWNPCNPLEGGN